jgi:hypothetical protein
MKGIEMGIQTNFESADEVVMLNVQRKAAITKGGAIDYAGRVKVVPRVEFDMGRTIFGGLKGVARRVMYEKLAKEIIWDSKVEVEVETAYVAAQATHTAPMIDPKLIQFMKEECDFSMEHADGTFLEHLRFCHDYAAWHYPAHSPNVALLHSILGTGTNTFALKREKLPKLKTLLTEFEVTHVEAFPSVLRLLFTGLIDELERNVHRLGKLKTLHCYRVIDNEPLQIDATNFWINLNYHLMHFVDFMPTANWSMHRSDPMMQMFERLTNLLKLAGQKQAKVEVMFPNKSIAPVGERRSLFGLVSGLLLTPALKLRLARKSIRRYSEQCSHDLSYQLNWTE